MNQTLTVKTAIQINGLPFVFGIQGANRARLKYILLIFE